MIAEGPTLGRFQPTGAPLGGAPLPGAAPISSAAKPLPADRWNGVAETGSKAWAGLDAIAATDAAFSGPAFIEGARKAYEIIVAAFAKGDRDTLRRLLFGGCFRRFRGRDFRSGGASRERRVRSRLDQFGCCRRCARAAAVEQRHRAFHQQADHRAAQPPGRGYRRRSQSGGEDRRFVDFRAQPSRARPKLEACRNRNRPLSRVAPAPLMREAVSFDGLEGFEGDDLEAALGAFRRSAAIIRAGWPEQRPARPPTAGLIAASEAALSETGDAASFFKSWFTPYRLLRTPDSLPDITRWRSRRDATRSPAFRPPCWAARTISSH